LGGACSNIFINVRQPRDSGTLRQVIGPIKRTGRNFPLNERVQVIDAKA
jgi:hypothetical protein